VINVRRAVAADVSAMSVVLIDSITELCLADHHGDADFLARWLSNKSPDGVRAMLANPNFTLLVAEQNGEVAAVGGIDALGKVALNYVSPRHRFNGVSKSLLAAMEAELKAHGHAAATLTSTATAHRFYLAAGWTDSVSDDGSYPMEKRLS
jgi:GNAT superfamily N-acetyltransferase